MSFKFFCPGCNAELEAQEEWIGQTTQCPVCNQNITVPSMAKTPPIKMPIEPTVAKNSVTPLGNVKFNVLGDYYNLYSCVQQVFQDCQSNIKKNDPFKGRIIGKCKYGINPFGITVTAIFYLNGNSTALEFSASLTDAFDTMGVCHKKVSEFSDRFMALFSSFQPNIAGKPKDFPPVPPNYSQRAGESHAGQAKTSFFLGIAGLFIGFLGILALILGAVALNKMAISNNEEGRGFAITGMILGVIEIIVMIIIFLILS